MNVLMPNSLKPHYKFEIAEYLRNLTLGDLQKSWRHLERAHVIGQSYPFQHTHAHWEMLKFGIKIKSLKEVFGQIPRLVVGGIKSFVGKIPVGNTGGSNVPPFKSSPIEHDILTKFSEARIKNFR